MLMLTATTSSLKAVMAAAAATTNPVYVAEYANSDGSTWTPGESDGAMNGTTAVTLVSAPASSNWRGVKHFTIYNGDTAAVTLTVYATTGSGDRTIYVASVPVNGTLTYDDKIGFRVRTTRGINTVMRPNLSRDLTMFSHVGGGASIQSAYPSGVVAANALSTSSINANTLGFVPFLAPLRDSPNIDLAGVYVTTGVGGSSARFGIYANRNGRGNNLPGALLYDSGTFNPTTSSTAHTTTPNLTLTPGALYWSVIITDTAGVSYRGFSATTGASLFGQATNLINSGTIHNGLTTPYTFDALPSMVPQNAVLAASSASPTVFIRYST